MHSTEEFERFSADNEFLLRTQKVTSNDLRTTLAVQQLNTSMLLRIREFFTSPLELANVMSREICLLTQRKRFFQPPKLPSRFFFFGNRHEFDPRVFGMCQISSPQISSSRVTQLGRHSDDFLVSAVGAVKGDFGLSNMTCCRFHHFLHAHTIRARDHVENYSDSNIKWNFSLQ